MRGCVLKQRHVAKDCEGCRTNRKEKEKEERENDEEERERSERLSANRTGLPLIAAQTKSTGRTIDFSTTSTYPISSIVTKHGSSAVALITRTRVHDSRRKKEREREFRRFVTLFLPQAPSAHPIIYRRSLRT